MYIKLGGFKMAIMCVNRECNKVYKNAKELTEFRDGKAICSNCKTNRGWYVTEESE